nr:myosin IC heavy chain-like [Cavia porcellus]
MCKELIGPFCHAHWERKKEVAPGVGSLDTESRGPRGRSLSFSHGPRANLARVRSGSGGGGPLSSRTGSGPSSPRSAGRSHPPDPVGEGAGGRVRRWEPGAAARAPSCRPGRRPRAGGRPGGSRQGAAPPHPERRKGRAGRSRTPGADARRFPPPRGPRCSQAVGVTLLQSAPQPIQH